MRREGFGEKMKRASVDDIRVRFEAAVRDSKSLAGTTPLGTMTINNEFHHYMDSDTDTMWIGFALCFRWLETQDTAELDKLART